MLLKLLRLQRFSLTSLAVLAVAAFGLTQTAYAWQTAIWSFGQAAPYGGEANSGTRTGAVEYSGSERRVRVGAQDIAYSQSHIDWMKNNIYQNAFVFHVNPKNGTGGTCTSIRNVNGWNWTNLPSASIDLKGCSSAPGNEVRFYFDKNGLSASATYYAQSLYKDTAYNGSPASKTVGEMNYDSYTALAGVGVNKDNHGKICIDPDTTYAPGTSGSC